MNDISAFPFALAAGTGTALAHSVKPSPAGSITPDRNGAGRSVSNHAIRAAVNDLNQAGYAGEGREVTFSVDPASRASVVRVVDSQTREVIVQLPSHYALQLAEENRKAQENQDEALLRTARS